MLGGSFNPPHLGHLAVALHALEELALERLLLVPLFSPPHRPPPADDPGPEHRLAMCRLLIEEELALADLGAQAASEGAGRAEGRGELEVSRLEIERGGRSYTVDTLEALHAMHPDTELTLVLGADMAVTLPAWRDPKEIVSLARLAIAERGEGREQIEHSLSEIGAEVRADYLEMAPMDVSSTEIRRRLAEGLPVDEQVGGAVASYITSHGLYGSGVRAGVP